MSMKSWIWSNLLCLKHLLGYVIPSVLTLSKKSIVCATSSLVWQFWLVVFKFVNYSNLPEMSNVFLLLLPGTEHPSWKFWPSQRPFHFPRSWTQAIQFLIFIWQMSCLMLSSHLYLGLPCDLLVRGFQLNIFLTVLVSGILCMWPNQLSFWALMSNIFTYVNNVVQCLTTPTQVISVVSSHGQCVSYINLSQI